MIIQDGVSNMVLVEQQSDPTAEVALAGDGADVADFFALLKPRVMSLVVFTALVGMVLAPGPLHPVLAAVSLLCIAVGAGASGALNMWYDADIDQIMTRTQVRPIPAGRVQPGEALVFGAILAAGSVALLGLTANWFAAGFLAFTIAFYILIYTMWLKRRTPQNIVIGGAAGAFPPMVAWAAVTGSIAIESVVLFAIIFLWTPPHFWALALFKSGDYERAGIPMLPVVAGVDATRRQIVYYSIILAPVGFLPAILGFAGITYAAVSVTLGAIFIYRAIKILMAAPDAINPAAVRLFRFSIFYLFALFALLLGEHLLGLSKVSLWTM